MSVRARRTETRTARTAGRRGGSARRTTWLLFYGLLLLLPLAAGADGTADLYFERIAVRELLPVLAQHYDLDLLVASDVPGIVTIDLQSKGIGAVLDEVLLGSGFTYHLSDGLLRVVPQDMVLGHTFRLDHVGAELLKENLSSLLTDADLAVDLGSNSITAVGSAFDLRQIARMIEEIDRMPRQVEIRSRMIDVNLTDTKSLGVDWNFRWSDDLQEAEGAATLNDPTQAAVTLRYARLSTVEAEAVIQAILQETDSKVVATPRIVAANNNTSKILVGERVPYTQFSVETATGAVQEQVAFADVGIQLEVTPVISRDSLISLDVLAEISEVLDREVQGIPRIGTREAQTRLSVANGRTVVIGGLRKDQTIESRSGVPLLHRIPILGRLFRSESTAKAQSELLVFLTPTIVDERSPAE